MTGPARPGIRRIAQTAGACRGSGVVAGLRHGRTVAAVT
jgi:hypothetical protein